MRIGIDGRLSGSRHAGIGRYVENLLTLLPAQAPEIEWIYFYSEPEQLAFAKKFDNVKLVEAPIRHYTLAEQWQLPPIINQAHLDLLHVPHFNVPLRIECPLVITIHDLLWHEFKGAQVTTLPNWLYWPKYLGYRIITRSAIQRAAKIFVPADTVRQTVQNYYPAASSKIVVTKEGVEEQFWSQVQPAKTPEPVLIYIGSLYPHKNVEVVIKALKHMPRYSLKIIGARNVFQDQVKALVAQVGVESQVEFTGYLSDQVVASVLRTSTALLQPSLSEGFGLTGVEAMASGIPVIASKIPIFKEIYQTAATFFDPTSPESLASAVETVALPVNRQKSIAAGQRLAQTYSWDKMVNETLTVYRQVVGRHG